ncbi:MAG: bile acid-coenzyme ligase [Actinomycetota bacterium]|jgi:bile acid-coenzyme A ligase|nr:bile acid-coenzyme ligase [Actinomycetota bacterium]
MAVMPIGAAIRWLAERDPERPAITCEGRTVTRAELDARTNKLARTYERLGVTEGDFVTIGLPNGIDFYEAAIAAWKLGATPQPVSYRLPQRERDEIVALAKPALVVTEPIAADEDASSEPILPDRTAPAYKAPTSGGSTGRPKVIVSGQAGTTDPEGPGAFGMEANGVQLVPGPLYHNAPFMFSMSGLFKGSHLIVMTRFDASLALELIEEHGVDWMLLVPTMMHRIWRLPEEERTKRDLSTVKGILHLAAPCPVWLKEAWIEWLGPERIWELYAGTEAQGVTIISGADWMAHKGSVGKPAEGSMKILDGDGKECPPGEVGEIWMRPPEAKTYRYLGADARRNDEGWESLGDLGSMDADGFLYLADRRTDLILAGGANIYPAEVEAALDEHPAVRSCAVIGLPDDDLGQRVHAVVEIAPGDPVTDDELRRFLADRLVSYKIPRSFDRSDGPVRDDAGKVRRSALKEQR